MSFNIALLRGLPFFKENKVSVPNISELHFVDQGLKRKTGGRVEEKKKRNNTDRERGARTVAHEQAA